MLNSRILEFQICDEFACLENRFIYNYSRTVHTNNLGTASITKFLCMCYSFVVLMVVISSLGISKSLRVQGRYLVTRSRLQLLSFSTLRDDGSSLLDSFDFITQTQQKQLNSLNNAIKNWNIKINLISRKDIDNLMLHHIIPSLSVALVRRFSIGDSVIDVGTGGGFPGLPLAIICPEAHFTLLDSNSKKMQVLQSVVEELGLSNVKLAHSRAEAHAGVQYKYVLGRSVKSLPEFVGYTSHMLQRSGRRTDSSSAGGEGGILYIKGGDIQPELNELGIKHSSIHYMRDLITGLETDKFVLYIPTADVPAAARVRKQRS